MTTISTLPPAPQPTDDTSTFNTKAFALLAALATFVSETNTVAGEVNTNATTATTGASTATTKAAEAVVTLASCISNALAAAASAGATAWVSGTTYAVGDVRWSPVDNRVYRRKVAGAGTTDPSADTTNWGLVATGAPQLIISTSTANAVSANAHIVLKNAAASTATLPASPAAGDIVWVTVGNGRFDNVIARNGQNIMGLAEDMTLDNPNATLCLRFIDSTLGWRII